MSKQDERDCNIPPLAVSELNRLDKYLMEAWETRNPDRWHVIRNFGLDGHRIMARLDFYGTNTPKEEAYLQIKADLPCYVGISCYSDYIPELAPEALHQIKARFEAWQAVD